MLALEIHMIFDQFCNCHIKFFSCLLNSGCLLNVRLPWSGCHGQPLPRERVKSYLLRQVHFEFFSSVNFQRLFPSVFPVCTSSSSLTAGWVSCYYLFFNMQPTVCRLATFQDVISSVLLPQDSETTVAHRQNSSGNQM